MSELEVIDDITDHAVDEFEEDRERLEALSAFYYGKYRMQATCENCDKEDCEFERVSRTAAYCVGRFEPNDQESVIGFVLPLIREDLEGGDNDV